MCKASIKARIIKAREIHDPLRRSLVVLGLLTTVLRI